MTTSTTLDVAKRIAPIADKHQMPIGMHGHSNLTDPNEFAAPESFAEGDADVEVHQDQPRRRPLHRRRFRPDRLHQANHANITNLHLKDRKKHQGDNTPWGEGETPIRKCCSCSKKNAGRFRAYIEYEYRGQGTPVAEVKKCYDYAKQALA